MRVMAFIPARKGSKGIPHKNMARLNGKPLVQYTIEAAQASVHVNTIFLSSDDPDVISLAESLGLEVPYRRPAELALDTTPMIDTVLDGLQWLRDEKGDTPDSILLLQPTSPLRRSVDIDNAIERFVATNSESLVSVHQMSEHPYECIKQKPEGWSFLQKPEDPAYRRQDYKDQFYFINGAIYLATVPFLIKNRSFVVEGNTTLYIMPPVFGLDVDTVFDLRKCEFYLKHGQDRNSSLFD